MIKKMINNNYYKKLIFFIFRQMNVGGHTIHKSGCDKYMREWGIYQNNKFALKWVVRGDQELPSVITRGVLWHYSRVYDG